MKTHLFLGLLVGVVLAGRSFAEVGLISGSSLQPALIVVQGDPADPEPHPQRWTADLDSGNPTMPVQGTPEDPEPRPRLWSILIDIDPGLTLNPGGDVNDDGAPSFGFGEMQETVPPTVAWACRVGSGNHDPAYAQYIDGQWTAPIFVTTDPGDDLDPRWWQDAAGTIHSAWWRRGTGATVGRVLYASRFSGSDAFSSEERVSLEEESARNATMAVLPTSTVLVGYETDPVNGVRNVIVASKTSAVGAFQRDTIATSSFANATRPELSNGAGHTWLTWIDTASRVGYSEMSGGVWSPPAYESYSNSEDIARARMRIRVSIVAQGRSLRGRTEPKLGRRAAGDLSE